MRWPTSAPSRCLVDAAAAAVSGGKRLRPAFCYWGWRGAGAPDDDEIIAPPPALELLQASALVHDDVMDALRHPARPARHPPAFAALHRDSDLTGTPDRSARRRASCSATCCLAWSDEMLRAQRPARPTRLPALRYFDSMRTELIVGQYLDLLDAGQRRRVASRGRCGGSGTSPRSTPSSGRSTLGAALAGAGQDLLTAYSAYGVPLGEAFQLRDDILGVFGDPQVTGKPAGDDLREGKRTVLAARAMESASPEDRATLLAALGRPDLDAAGCGRCPAGDHLVRSPCGRRAADQPAHRRRAHGSRPGHDRRRRGTRSAGGLADAATKRDV